MKNAKQKGCASVELLFVETVILMVAVFTSELLFSAVSKAAFQGDICSYLSQIASYITARDVLFAAGAALLSPFVLCVLFVLGVLAYGAYEALLRRFCGRPLPEEDVSGPPALWFPETPEEVEAFARSGDPEKRRLAVRSPACPLNLVWDALADGDKKVRLNALCRLVVAGVVTEEKAREMFSSWFGVHRRYAEKNFGCLLEAYLHTGQRKLSCKE